MAGLVLLLFATPAVLAQRSPPGCTGSGLGISLFTSIPDVHIGDTIRYSVNVFNAPFPACDASDIRAFIVTPDGVTNVITLRRTTLLPGEADMYPEVVSYVVRAQDIRPDGTVRATASDDGEIWQNDVHSRGGSDQGVNTQVNLPCVQISALCVGTVGENGAITFTGSVTNCGNNTLVGVTVTNVYDGGAHTVLFPTNLAIGQVATFSGSYIPANPCAPSTATLTVLATDQFTSTPRTVTSFTTITCATTLTQGIQVTKVCPTQPVSPGQLLTFSGSVSNTGNVTLNNIVVVNSQPAANTPIFTLPSLAPGQVVNFTGSYLAPTNCTVADTLTATASSRCGVAVSSTASATCPILTTPAIALSVLCPETPVTSGGGVVYTGTVRNTGDITLNNIIVISDRPAPNSTAFTIGTLAPGASATFTSRVTAPANACSLTATFNAMGKDACTPNMVTNTVSVTCPILTAPAIAVTLACPPGSASAGGPITYTGTVRNTGNVTLNDVFVVNNQPSPNTQVIGPLTLAPGEVSNFNALFTAPTDACSVASTVTATGSDSCSGAAVTQTASATCPLLTAPAIVVTQDCPVNPAIPGALLSYTGTVRNSGNVTLTNVVVVNSLSGTTPVFTAATLAPGDVASFTGSYVTTTNCSSASVSTATARSLCGIAVTHTVSPNCPLLTAPQIAVTATCPTGPILPGGAITYTGTVRNTGNITLTNVTVISDRPAANTSVFTVRTLAPGASANFTGTVTAPAGACTVITTFTANARDFCSLAEVTQSVSTTCTVTTAPAIAVTVTCPTVSPSVGGTIAFTGTVRNSGNVTLNNVFVVNNHPVANSQVVGPLTLAPGETSNFNGTFTAPADACAVVNTLVATGADSCTEALVTHTASATCSLLTAPAIAVTQECPVNPAIPGGPLVFSGTVRNAGNVTLTNVVMVNNLTGATPIFTAPTLAPGEIVGFTGSYLATTNCSSTSTSTATGRSICGIAVSQSASATCPTLTSPAIVVTQSCPTTPVLPGGILTFSGTVRNSGDSLLTNIVVVNNWPIPGVVVFTAPSLEPGATRSFTGSYQVPDNCCVAWLTLQARGQACDGVLVTDTDSGTCTVLTAPQLVVTEVCPPEGVKPGEVMYYSGTVRNAGNITLVNVTVANSQSPAGSPLLGPITLAPGETVRYDAPYLVTPDFCGTDKVTAQGLDACSYAPVVHSVTLTCPAITTPRIAVVKRCPPEPTPHDQPLVFSGTVSNPGNVTLVNVYVVNNQPSNNTPIIGPITLAPGASMDFSGSYTAPPFCCEITDTLTARGQDRCTSSNVTATATAICPLLYTPAIAVVQACPPNRLTMGSLYSFSGFVTNTGDAILTNVVVYASPDGPGRRFLGPVVLAPGESAPYSGSLTVPMNSCSVVFTASSQETCKAVEVTGTSTCLVATTPLITVTQICPANPVNAGDPLTYSGTVSNAGNITLTQIRMTNDQGGSAPLLSIDTLAPGAVATYIGSYVAPVTGPSTSTSTANAVTPCGEPVANSASSSCPIASAPSIAMSPGLVNGLFRISFATEAGSRYAVQYKNALNDPVWTDLQNVIGTGGNLTVTDPTPALQPGRFYRVIPMSRQ